MAAPWTPTQTPFAPLITYQEYLRVERHEHISSLMACRQIRHDQDPNTKMDQSEVQAHETPPSTRRPSVNQHPLFADPFDHKSLHRHHQHASPVIHPPSRHDPSCTVHRRRPITSNAFCAGWVVWISDSTPAQELCKLCDAMRKHFLRTLIGASSFMYPHNRCRSTRF